MNEDTQEIQKTVDGIIAEMATIRIEDETSAMQAGEFLKKNKETQKFVKDYFEDARAATYKSYKMVTDTISFFVKKLQKAETAVKRKISDYQMEQERIRREEARKLEAEARKREEERRLAKAIETGDEEILDKPVDVTPVRIEEPRKMEGVSFVERWTYQIQDVSQIPREFLIPDERKIRSYVTSMKDKAKIPGVRIYADKTVRVSS
jgi:hypothetical protein